MKFETLFSSWKTFRHAMGENDEDAAFQAYSVFEDACDTVAGDGRLDEAVNEALARMPIEDAGDFYSDLLSFASECDLDAMANDEPASVNARVFGIPAMGEFGALGRLHGNSALVKCARGSGLADKQDVVVLVGALPMDAAARTSPQAIWNLAREGAHVLSQVHHSDFDHSQVHDLRNFLAVLPDAEDEQSGGLGDFDDHEMGQDGLDDLVADDDGEENRALVIDETTVGSALLVGIRVHIALREEMESDTIAEDPLDDPSEDALLEWERQATAAMETSPLCAVMLPMPWRDSVVQSMAASAESQILLQGQYAIETVEKMTIKATNDGVVLTGYTEDGDLLGQYTVPTDVSFWAMTELVAQFQGQGMDVELLPSTKIDLATMSSPGRMLN